MNSPPRPEQCLVIAEMNTHAFMFRGAGETRELARSALLRAWTRHRTDLLVQYPELEATITETQEMVQHFRIVYLEFVLDGGYRDLNRIA